MEYYKYRVFPEIRISEGTNTSKKAIDIKHLFSASTGGGPIKISHFADYLVEEFSSAVMIQWVTTSEGPEGVLYP